MSYGIVLAKDVRVRTRDGIELATDVYRPARDGDWAEGRFPTILCRTPYDRTDKRYTEIADFFVPRGYAVCLQDLRDRYGSDGTGDYQHTVTPQQGEDGYRVAIWNGENGAAYFTSPRPFTASQRRAIARVRLFNEGENPEGCGLRTMFSWE